MKPIIVFGTGTISEIVSTCIEELGAPTIAAFAVDSEYLKENSANGVSVISLDSLPTNYPPSEYDIFVAIGYQELNQSRADKLAHLIALGYTAPTLVHPNADVAKGVTLGKNCLVMGGVSIQPGVSIGDNVFIWSGSVIGHHSRIADNCWITSSACICGFVEMGANCFVGANATIGNEVKVGNRCFIGAASLVAKDLASEGVVIQESSEKIRLTSKQFLRMSKFK